MNTRKKIIAICGSTRSSSANLSILKAIAAWMEGTWEVEIYDKLAQLPHFNPDLDNDSPPEAVVELRSQIADADGVIICTPEYVFSLPGSIKNAIEWTVSTTIFSEKPVALITASASGMKAHESLVLVIKTLYAKVNDSTNLLIQGAKGKIGNDGTITDENTALELKALVKAFGKVLS